MCKLLFYRQLLGIIVAIGSVLMGHSQSTTSLHSSRSLSIDEMAGEELHHIALAEITTIDDLGLNIDIDRIQVVGMLHTRYPELAKVISDLA